MRASDPCIVLKRKTTFLFQSLAVRSSEDSESQEAEHREEQNEAKIGEADVCPLLG
jgi:hypothetical protein